MLAIGPLWEGGQTRCPLKSLLTSISMKYYNTLQVNSVSNVSCLLNKTQAGGQIVSGAAVLLLNVQMYFEVDCYLPPCSSESKLSNDTVGTNHS